VKNAIVMILAFLSVITVGFVVANSASQEFQGQKWEYAQLAEFQGAFGFSSENQEEMMSIVTTLGEIADKEPLHLLMLGITGQRGSAYLALNIVGDYGWELVAVDKTVVGSDILSEYTLKRPRN
jgi:hypothetical protein